jgi:hypothetical protein
MLLPSGSLKDHNKTLNINPFQRIAIIRIEAKAKYKAGQAYGETKPSKPQIQMWQRRLHGIRSSVTREEIQVTALPTRPDTCLTDHFSTRAVVMRLGLQLGFFYFN